MNILKIGLIICSLTCLLFVTCTKNQEVIVKPRLFITLKDDSGRSVAGATVRLYKTAQGPGITQISDTAGVVFFENLDAELYYWSAEKGCKTNKISQNTLNRPLIEDVVLYGYSVLSETGILKITNSSGEPYKVKDTLISLSPINITLFNITLNDTPYIADRRIGFYKIHSEKLSAPGTGKDSTIEIRCADTTRLVLPY